MTQRSVWAGVGRGAGIALIVLGCLAAAFGLLGLFTPGPLVGALFFVVVGASVGGLGYGLVRLGSRSTASGPHDETPGLERHARVLMTVALLVLGLGSGTAGVVILATGSAPSSTGGVFLALAPVVLGGALLVALDPRRFTTGQQYAFVLTGYGIGIVVIAVVGITAEDARQLLTYAVVGAGGAGAAVAARARQRRD